MSPDQLDVREVIGPMSELIAQETIDALVQATSDARQAIRQAHEAIKDLRAEVKEARYVAGNAYEQAVQAAAAIEEQARERMQFSMDTAHEVITARIRELTELAAEGKPIRFTCSTPGCNELLMALDDGKPITCPTCHRSKALKRSSNPSGGFLGMDVITPATS